MNSKVLVVIPTFNCAVQIIKVLKNIQLVLDSKDVEVWVVDNQSIDSTFENALSFVTERKIQNVHVYQAFQNNSLGGTIKIAFNSAIKMGFEDVIIFHGDNQGDILDVCKLINFSRTNKVPYSILGSRFMRNSKLIGYSRKRIFGNLVLNSIYSLFTLRILSDLGSGLNMYKVKDISDINYLQLGDSLTFNYELLLLMISNQKHFQYHPIVWREEDQISNAKNLTIFIAALRILFNYLIKKSNSVSESSKVYKIK